MKCPDDCNMQGEKTEANGESHWHCYCPFMEKGEYLRGWNERGRRDKEIVTELYRLGHETLDFDEIVTEIATEDK